MAETLNDFGDMLRQQNRLEEAREAYEEALKICRKLAQQNSVTYPPNIAESLNNLGNLNHDENRMDEAQENFSGALAIYEPLEGEYFYAQEVRSTKRLAQNVAPAAGLPVPQVTVRFVVVLRSDVCGKTIIQTRPQDLSDYSR